MCVCVHLDACRSNIQQNAHTATVQQKLRKALTAFFITYTFAPPDSELHQSVKYGDSYLLYDSLLGLGSRDVTFVVSRFESFALQFGLESL